MYTIGGTLYHSDGKGNMLMHGAKGSEWKNHKYIDKVKKNGRWIYTYAKSKIKKATGLAAKENMDKYSQAVSRHDKDLKNAKKSAAKYRKEKNNFTDAYTTASRSSDDYNNMYEHGKVEVGYNTELAKKATEGSNLLKLNESQQRLVNQAIESWEKNNKNKEYAENFRNAANRYQNRANEAGDNYKRASENVSKASKQKNEARERYNQAEQEYNNSLVGKVDSALEKIKKKKKK